MSLQYLVIGAGGTGGALGGYLARAGKDVTLIARGAHLAALRQSGLLVKRPEDSFLVQPIRAEDMAGYDGHPDVIFVCVKGYSLADTVPFIQRIATPDTVVIPILNIYGTGAVLQEALPDLLVTDGCIYVASQIESPGVIRMNGTILRVVYGVRDPREDRPVLHTVEQDLNESGILGILSPDIRRDALVKFSYVSPQGACGLYYGIPAGPMQQPGPYRDCFASLVHEIELLGGAMGITFEEDLVARNLKILDDLAPGMTTSLQRDIAAGKQSEIDGLIYRVPEMAAQYGVTLPTYEKIAAALKGGRCPVKAGEDA